MIEGVLKLESTKRWAIYPKGDEYPFEITSGEVFELFLDGQWKSTRMESSLGAYYSVDGFQLEEGMRARYIGRTYQS